MVSCTSLDVQDHKSDSKTSGTCLEVWLRARNGRSAHIWQLCWPDALSMSDQVLWITFSEFARCTGAPSMA